MSKIVGGSSGIVAHSGTDDDAMLFQPKGFKLQYCTVGRYLMCALYLILFVSADKAIGLQK